MSDGKGGVWNAKSREVYRRLLGFSVRYWPIGLIAIVGMLLDGGGLALFNQMLKILVDKLFRDKDAYWIFWMPIWIIGIFYVRAIGTFASDYGISYIGRHVVQAMQVVAKERKAEEILPLLLSLLRTKVKLKFYN